MEKRKKKLNEINKNKINDYTHLYSMDSVNNSENRTGGELCKDAVKLYKICISKIVHIPIFPV